MIKIGVVFGGKSSEHSISIMSGCSIAKNLNKLKYEVVPIYIDREGNWYEVLDDIYNMPSYKLGEEPINLKTIENVIKFMQELDCAFPVLRGKGGDDGSIQGLLNFTKIPYVGCGILSSSVAMDKLYMKTILAKAEVMQTKYFCIKNTANGIVSIDNKFNEKEVSMDELLELVYDKLKYPVFVKPANSGASIGVNKATTSSELRKSIESAFFYDDKIILEKEIKGREIEIALLGNDNVITSYPGEVDIKDEFYNYNSKYQNPATKTMVPLNILGTNLEDELREIAIKVFKAIGAKDLARVDFFVEERTNVVYVNEINTMPDITEDSMYIKLFDAIGIEYTELLDRLIKYAMKKDF
ncbi:MAG: D-alanine--D-alanine ligase family protein [Clostridia bacterium]